MHVSGSFGTRTKQVMSIGTCKWVSGRLAMQMSKAITEGVKGISGAGEACDRVRND